MSPRTGRPPKCDTPKRARIEFRFTEKKAEQLLRCSKKLKVSRTEVVERGIDLVDAELNGK